MIAQSSGFVKAIRVYFWHIPFAKTGESWYSNMGGGNMRLKMMNQVIPVEKVLAEYVDAPKFLKACSECPNYGKIASCPPYDFDVIDYWRQFKSFHIAAVQGFVPDELRERAFSADELNAKTREIFKSMRDSLDGKLEQAERETPDSRMLSAGKCVRCADCACARGLPCRFPELIRYSVESLGGDVVKLLRDVFRVDILWAQNGRLPEYFMLVGGLLTK